MAAGGAVYADLGGIPAGAAVAIIAAYLVQATFYLLPGFPAARGRVEQALSDRRLALGLTAAALAPYLIYSIPLGVFSWASLLQIAALAGGTAFVFVLFPPRSPGFTWRDALALGLPVAPAIGGLTTFFLDNYPTPGPPIPRLDSLGKLMVISLGAMTFLSLRRLPDVDYRFALTRRDLAIGCKHFLRFLAVGTPLALATGFARWSPRSFDDWSVAAELAGKTVGIYLATALPEELCFRGVLQNLLARRLGRERAAQAIAAAAFGLTHLAFRGYPNWPHVGFSALLGWFCGDAYREARGVVPAAVAHALAVIALAFLFAA